jgi:hypothetical protein
MFSQLQSLEIRCDAPPYAVVRACKDFDFHSPLDVRWCRMSHLASAEEKRKDYFGIRLLKRLLEKNKTKAQTCTCGQPLPDLKKYDFTFHSKKVGCYLLGQCRRCRTMYWDDNLPLAAWMEEGVAGLTDDF